jgi:hypothetical protein
VATPGRTARLALRGALARAVLLASALAALPAGALELEKLVMPGPVIRGHADVEAECTRCHTPFRRETESRLCLECHDPVGADLKERRGYHGLASAAGEATCRSCHPDHRGRDADVSGLEPDTFDHELTDAPLRGAHRSLPCASCHEPEKKHRDAPADCAGCRTTTPRGRLERCADCRNEVSWREWRFDHGETDFPLEGGHGDVACGLCRRPALRDTPAACASCHAVDDVSRRLQARVRELPRRLRLEKTAPSTDRDTTSRSRRGPVDCAACTRARCDRSSRRTASAATARTTGTPGEQ